MRILFLLAILLAQFGLMPLPSLAQTDEDSEQVKKVVENFLRGVYAYNLDSAISNVSTSYRGTSRDTKNEIGYAEFKEQLADSIEGMPKKYVDNSITDFQVLKSVIKGGTATIVIQLSWSRFNLESLQNETIVSPQVFSLAKEDGSWKITNSRRLRGPPKRN